MSLTQEQFETLDEGAQVVVGTDLDNPFKKIDDDWFESATGVRVRTMHFTGAVQAGALQPYDQYRPRRWQVVHGGTYYSVLLRESTGPYAGENYWDCLTFTRSDPSVMYSPGILPNIDRMSRGTTPDDPDEVPWQEFFKGLAAYVETSEVNHAAEIERLRAEITSLTDANRRLQADAVVARTFRASLRRFMAEESEPLLFHEETGCRVGEFVLTTPQFNGLPLGSVVVYNDQPDNYWWKETATQWRRRDGQRTSATMTLGRNRLLSIGNGIAVDPGTVMPDHAETEPF